ncbi:GspE/PulE family protein [Acidobacteriota bacterium]
MLKTARRGLQRPDLARKKEEEDRQRALAAQGDRGVVKEVDGFIDQAIEMNGTEIHIEIIREGPRVRIRNSDGALAEIATPESKAYTTYVNRLKVLAGMDITNFKTPQRGYFKRSLEDRSIEFEAYSFPSIYGEIMMLKLQEKKDIELKIDQLGFEGQMLEQYQNLLQKGHGLILVIGPPGNGKNTTLYSSINSLNSTGRNVCTCETFIKYNLPGVVQGRYDDRSEISYEEYLRSLVYQEPDLMLVGEIKTAKAAKIVVQAAFAKRFVFGRLVANDAISGIQSFLDMEIEPFLVSTSIHCALAQRLIRRLCSSCRQQYTPTAGLIKEIGFPLKSDIKFFRNVGCSECNQTGFKGYVAIFELFRPTEQIREMIATREPMQKIRQKAAESGMTTLKKDGIMKAFQGLTTVEEVLTAL